MREERREEDIETKEARTMGVRPYGMMENSDAWKSPLR